MKALLFIGLLFLVVGVISMPDDSSAPASRAAPTSLNAAGIAAAVRAMPEMQQVQVQVKLQNLRTAFYIYAEEFGDVPDPAGGLLPLTGLTGLVSAADLTDPWGHEFVYRRTKVGGNGFWDEFEVQVFSAGPDGVADTADDIHLP